MTFSARDPVVGLVSPDLFPDSQENLGEKMIEYEHHRFMTIIGPVPPGTYRYRFTSDRPGEWRKFRFPEKTPMDMRDVAHGVVAGINYYSPYQRAFVQFHVYTPPGYEKNDKSYPLLYIFCGDRSYSSEAWGELSRVNLILDNLIAEGKAQPMVVAICSNPDARFAYNNLFRNELREYVEKNYRLLPGGEHRALLGSSILDLAFQEQGKFAYVANLNAAAPYFPFFSEDQDEVETWEKHHQRQLADADWKNEIRLFWFGYRQGFKESANVDQLGLLLTQNNFPVEVYRSDKVNYWQNQRDYLIELLPKLFQASEN